MYHLVIENLGVRRCLAVREKDDFREGMHADCSLDHGCIPAIYVRKVTIRCVGDRHVEMVASVYSD